MTKEIWLNLPVKDVRRSKEFFTKLGFKVDLGHGEEPTSAGMTVGTRGMMIMLFEESVFRGFIRHEIADPAKGSEIIISFDAESRAEIDDYARRAEEAGGKLFGKPAEIQGWMYGCGFCDLDGHRWNALYMDKSRMPPK